MGRTEPSLGRPPAGFRRDARAKRARATANKVIPSVLAAHPRARRGVKAAELIVDPPPSAARVEEGIAEEEGDATRPLRISVRRADALAVAHELLSPRRAGAGEAGGQAAAAGGRDRRGRVRGSGANANPGPDLSNRTARVGILHMASPLSADGGFLNGSAAAAGEPSSATLLGRTTLLPSLRDAFYRLPELGVVYTPDVLVFRGHGGGGGGGVGGNDDDGGEDALLPRADRWFVDCISAAMLRLPETQEVAVAVAAEAEAGQGLDVAGSGPQSDSEEEEESTTTATAGGTRKAYASAADRELAGRKMRAVLRVAQAKGVRKLVLGAWGCGAYGNPVEEVAAAWHRVLLGGARARGNHGHGHGGDVGDHRDGTSHKNKKNDDGGNGSGNRGGTRGRGSKGKSKNGSRGAKAKPRQRETWHGIEEVVFAIRNAGVAERFAEAFGDDALLWDHDDEEDQGGREKARASHEDDADPWDHSSYKDNTDADTGTDGGQGDPEQRRLRELRAKIRQLELQAGQARSPQLRAGLGAVLAGLRAQLPGGGGGGEDEEEEEGEEQEEQEEKEENGVSTDGDDSASSAGGKSEDEEAGEEQRT